MDTTDIIGDYHDSHHIYSKQVVSFLCGCESFVFQHEHTCWIIFRCIGKRETKGSSLHCNDCKKINDENADMDHHAVLPPDYKSGGDSQREELCQQDPQTFTTTATGASMLNSGEGTVYSQAHTGGEHYDRKFDDLAMHFAPRSEEEHVLYNLVLNSICAKCGKIS